MMGKTKTSIRHHATNKNVSEYDQEMPNHTLQTNLRRCEEETTKTNSHTTLSRQLILSNQRKVCKNQQRHLRPHIKTGPHTKV